MGAGDAKGRTKTVTRASRTKLVTFSTGSPHSSTNGMFNSLSEASTACHRHIENDQCDIQNTRSRNGESGANRHGAAPSSNRHTPAKTRKKQVGIYLAHTHTKLKPSEHEAELPNGRLHVPWHQVKCNYCETQRPTRGTAHKDASVNQRSVHTRIQKTKTGVGKDGLTGHITSWAQRLCAASTRPHGR
jgi:hypothetical protein